MIVMDIKACLRISGVVSALLLMSGCSTIAYYGQSILGHSRLMLARQPLERAIQKADKVEDHRLSEQLQLVGELRRYAIVELALPDNGSYDSYVALNREFPVWSVVAAEEFSIEAKTWCYPVAGCAAYRGYFSQKAAQNYANKLHQKGYETAVGGVGAYSTLGWFDDPVLPSMLRYGIADFAETLFHELAHQQLYIKDDSDFNEAFATVVGEQGAVRWLRANRPDLLTDYRRSLAARIGFGEMLENLKQRLALVYVSPRSPEEMRVAKQQLLQDLRIEYDKLKAKHWQGFAGYDHWFEQPINNARLAAFSTYRRQAPQLQLLLDSCQGDFVRFYKKLAAAKSTDNRIPLSCDS